MGDRPTGLTGPKGLGSQLAGAALLALGLGLCAPLRLGESSLDVGALAVWVALVPLAWLVSHARPFAAGLWGGLGAVVGLAVAHSWVALDPRVDGWALGRALGVGGVLLGGLASAAAWLWARTPPAAGIWVLPCGWVIAEHLIVVGVGPSLAGGLATSLARDGPALELAALGGGSLLSLVVAAVAVQLARREIRVALLAVAGIHALGLGLRVYHQSQLRDSDLRVGIVQADPQDSRCERFREATLLLAASAEVDLVVWPPGSLSGECGVDSSGLSDSSFAPASWRVAATSAGSSGAVELQVLDPRGELRSWRVACDGPLGGSLSADAVPGADSDRSREPDRAPELRGDPVGAVLVCYELSDRAQVGRRARAGVRALVDLVDDPTLGRSAASDRRLALASLRAAETGVPVLSVARAGGSAVVDAGGWVQLRGPRLESFAYTLPLPAARPATLYARAGDWVFLGSGGLWLCVGLCVGGGCLGRERRRRRSRTDP